MEVLSSVISEGQSGIILCQLKPPPTWVYSFPFKSWHHPHTWGPAPGSDLIPFLVPQPLPLTHSTACFEATLECRPPSPSTSRLYGVQDCSASCLGPQQPLCWSCWEMWNFTSSFPPCVLRQDLLLAWDCPIRPTMEWVPRICLHSTEMTSTHHPSQLLSLGSDAPAQLFMLV